MQATVFNADYERLVGFLSLNTSYGWEENDMGADKTLFSIYGRDRGELVKLSERLTAEIAGSETVINEVVVKDWLVAWKQFFTPVECGARFVVLPPWLAHYEHSKRTAIIIDPKNAFGTGHHASTELCLTALSNLLDEGRIGKKSWFLDLGCGSGILGLAACKMGLDGTGVDIDPEAIANARENRELNQVEHLELLKGGIEKVRGEKFDLVMANILAGPLIEMAPQVAQALKEDGVLILSGILAEQKDAVVEAYQKAGLGPVNVLLKDEWAALIWK